MVGHDLQMILRMADHVTCINRSVIFDGGTEVLKDTEYMAGLFGASGGQAKKISGDSR
jgi:ABC-type Mn2+/Zn2+ transport system ATPase subunit